LVDAVEARYPGIRGYLCEETGRLRKHVNVFIGNNQIVDRVGLSDSLAPGDEVFIMQALSGG
ncbi:MAG: MoaD/ThiS family protein, partial [Myxococcales bacterium]|nr:MoaD/ThiS family protein [Myxococcales bacterium]